jgi:hypothetical protein
MSLPSPGPGLARTQSHADRSVTPTFYGSPGLSLVAFVFLGATALVGLLTVATTTDISSLALATGVCGLFGLTFTLIAVIVGIVRAIRNHQWRWLASILVGTALPLQAAVVAEHLMRPLYEPNGLQQVVPYYVGLACAPLAVVAYSVVGRRVSGAEESASGRNSAYSDTRAWLGAVGTVAALALTLIASLLTSSWAGPGRSHARARTGGLYRGREILHQPSAWLPKANR